MRPITTADRLETGAMIVLFSVGILWLGKRIHQRIAKDDVAKQVQGRPVRYWMAGGYFVGGMWACVTCDRSNPNLGGLVSGISGATLLLGWLIGMVHGYGNLCIHRSKEASRNQSAS